MFVLLGLLTVVPPLGAIPGLPAVMGGVILLFSVQMLFGSRHIWLPGFITKFCFDGDKLTAAERKAEPTLKFIDGLVTARLRFLTTGPAEFAAAILVSIMAVTMIPLELVPFAVAAPGAAITMVGVALLAKDGALMLLAYAISGVAIAVLFHFSPWNALFGG